MTSFGLRTRDKLPLYNPVETKRRGYSRHRDTAAALETDRTWLQRSFRGLHKDLPRTYLSRRCALIPINAMPADAAVVPTGPSAPRAARRP